MVARNTFVSGEWNVICDVCSKKIKASQAKHRWDGFIVCSEDFEFRHPQDFVKPRQDNISIPFARPRPPDIFVDVTYVDTDNSNIPSGNFDGTL